MTRRSKDFELALFECLSAKVEYDKDTGAISWKAREEINPQTERWNKKFAGSACGCDNGRGYITIKFKFDGKEQSVYAHRLAWFIANGVQPDEQIDHINGDRKDNRIINLRAVTNLINSMNRKIPTNNTSGVGGVQWKGGRWYARAAFGGRNKRLGAFENIEDAKAAIVKARVEFGYSERHCV